jgi:hypothetical protein
MQKIVERCNFHIYCHSGIYEDFQPMSVQEHLEKPALTLWQAANLTLGVCKHKDGEAMQAIADGSSSPLKERGRERARAG